VPFVAPSRSAFQPRYFATGIKISTRMNTLRPCYMRWLLTAALVALCHAAQAHGLVRE
jgi:hypothetical protein